MRIGEPFSKTVHIKRLAYALLVDAKKKHNNKLNMRIVKTKNTNDNLCKYCQNDFPTCPKANHIVFGNGIGNDNITECSEFVCTSWLNNFPIEGTNKFAKRI